MACTRRHTTTPFIKIFRESESVGQIPDPSTFFSPATGWKREERKKREKKTACRMLLRNIHVHVPIRRSQFCRERLNYDTIESNSRPFNRNRRGFLVPRSEKIDISKRRDKRWTRATRCTIHGGKNKIWNGVCFNFQDRTCWLDLRFDSRQWLRLDIIVRFNFQRVTPSNYDRYI